MRHSLFPFRGLAVGCGVLGFGGGASLPVPANAFFQRQRKCRSHALASRRGEGVSKGWTSAASDAAQPFGAAGLTPGLALRAARFRPASSRLLRTMPHPTQANERLTSALQRTGPAVTAPASGPPPSPHATQGPRQPGQSLSYRSLGVTAPLPLNGAFRSLSRV